MKLDTHHVVVWNGTDRTSRYLGDHLARPEVVHPIEPPRTLCTDAQRDRILEAVVDCGGAPVKDIAAAAGVDSELAHRALGRLLRAGTVRRELRPLSPRRQAWHYWPC